MALRKIGIGTPENSDVIGGSVISKKVRIVFSWPVPLAQLCRASAQSSGFRQYSKTALV